jgi:broad specificity phosphatase PhoE
MIMRIMWILSLSLVAFTTVADDLLWEKLRQDSNMVVLVRNSESSGNRDGANMLVWDASGNCTGESTLTARGRAQAKKIGETFAKHGIRPIVISSPMCRCSETSRIAFGEYITDPDLRQMTSGDTPQQELFQARASTLLRKYRGTNPVVFVNHRPNIDALTMELLDVGDLLIGTILATGEIEVLGKIHMGP